jgi:hypothetical protein
VTVTSAYYQEVMGHLIEGEGGLRQDCEEMIGQMLACRKGDKLLRDLKRYLKRDPVDLNGGAAVRPARRGL